MFEKLDRIVLNEKDIKEISYFCYKNKGKFDSVDFPMREGLLIQRQYVDEYRGLKIDDTLEQVNYFKIADDGVFFKMFESESDMHEVVSFFATVNEERNKLEYTNVKMRLKDAPKEEVKRSMDAMVLILFDTFQYMNHSPQIVKEIKETKIVSKKQKSKKSSKSNKTRQVKINTTKYVFDHSEEHRRSYEITAESWNVRGHWRYYKKTGKSVWIKPYVKGIGENIEPKEYKI
jgi:endonuclease I